MKYLLLFLCIGLALMYVGCSENSPLATDVGRNHQPGNALAKEATPNLEGWMELVFTGPVDPVWSGTVTIEGYGEYGMRFYHTSGPPRDYSMASPFEEYYEIYDLGDPSVVYVAGTDAGVTTLANSIFRMNGTVDVANGPFSVWLGRNVHMSGDIYWLPSGLPGTADGTFRIN